jgi:hypothetical protein
MKEKILIGIDLGGTNVWVGSVTMASAKSDPIKRPRENAGSFDSCKFIFYTSSLRITVLPSPILIPTLIS